MLSRVAERVYWMSRYLERVENTARLVAVYGELLLDLPDEAGLDWSLALRILGTEEAYSAIGAGREELDFLLTSEDDQRTAPVRSRPPAGHGAAAGFPRAGRDRAALP
jgi:uncharacterized alpha-E superfamily protein